MKIKIAIAVFCFGLNYNLIAQNYFGSISYSKRLVSSSSSSSSSSDNSNNEKETYMYKRYKSFESDFLDLNYTLKFNSKESTFICEGLINMDDGPKKRIIIGAGRGNGVYYTNIEDDYRLNQKEAFGALFLVSSRISDENWTLVNESKMIGDYLCYKATTFYIVKNSKGTFNHPVEVWYTNQIPISFGPVGYGGLPGLIIELTVQEIQYFITKVSLSNDENVKIKTPTKGKLVTEKEFNAIGAEAVVNFRSKISN